MLTAMNQFNGGTPLLDIRKLIEGNSYDVLAYVNNVKSGITVNETGYYSFYVKDCNGNVIPARLFNVAEFYEAGFSANSLKNKPVKLSCIAQIVYGQWSLLVKEISEWTGDFDYKSFKGFVEYDEKYLTEEFSQTGSFLPVNFCTKGLTSICDGKCGGFALYLGIVFKKLHAMGTYSGVYEDTLLRIATRSASVYFNYLELKDNFGFVSKEVILKTLYSYCIQDVNDVELILDAMTGLTDLGEPQFLESALVVKVFKDTLVELNMISAVNKVPKGSAVTVNGLQLFSV